jgi:endonuclease YncB( thermonuclease family)
MKRVPAFLLLVSCAVAAQGFEAGSAPVAALASSPGVPPVVAQAFSPASGRFTGRVIGVLDGDSLLVLRDGRQVEVRLYGVDAPERGQAFGSVARRFLSNLVFGKTVVVEVRDIDRYKRSVSRLTVDGADVSLDIIRAGFGWHYTQYSSDARYAAAEQEARAARRGLWQDNAPIAPWHYRQRRASPLPTPPPKPGTAASPSGPFHGNVSSHVFHGPSCEYYNCKNCTAVFATSEAAVAAGYRPHTDCVRR